MNVPIAEIITIGDEILYGQINDTNSQWICENLSQLGIKVAFRSTIGDNKKDIIFSFARAKKRSDLIIITGGLGPTPDDLTKPCLAEFFGVGMKKDPQTLSHLEALFRQWGKELTATNETQAELPENARVLNNYQGTAPGMWFEEGNKVYVSLPGVPFEMKSLMKNEVFPAIQKRWQLPVIFHRTIKTAGIGESYLHDLIHDWEKNLPEHIKLAYLPTFSQVKLRLTSSGSHLEELQTDTEREIEKVIPLIGKYIYGYDNDTLESSIGVLLNHYNYKIATAESCTGGHTAHLLTSVPGSSHYYKGSVIAYANEVKINELQVNNEDLEVSGAVSEAVVTQMVKGVCLKMGVETAVATSGIAGPDGGTTEKPVGTIWIASCVKGDVKTRLLNLGPRDRSTIINISSLAALNLLRLHLHDVRTN